MGWWPEQEDSIISLSLRNIGKKITDVVGGVERQVNPFDNGATYSNPTASGPVPASFAAQANRTINPFNNNSTISRAVGTGVHNLEAAPGQLANTIATSPATDIGKILGDQWVGNQQAADRAKAQLHGTLQQTAQTFQGSYGPRGKRKTAPGVLNLAMGTEGGLDAAGAKTPKPSVTLKNSTGETLYRSENPARYGVGQAELGSGLYVGSKETAGRLQNGKIVTDGLHE